MKLAFKGCGHGLFLSLGATTTQFPVCQGLFMRHLITSASSFLLLLTSDTSEYIRLKAHVTEVPHAFCASVEFLSVCCGTSGLP